MLLSIVVPVYNAEKYLEACLRSLQIQKEQNFEVILVNDGSEDSSEAICRSYENRDGRFHYIEQHNQGVSVARNTGIQYASGQYISFVDADDWVADNYVASLEEKIRKQEADLYIFNYEFELETTSDIINDSKVLSGRVKADTDEERFRLIMDYLNYQYRFSVRNKAYRAEILHKYRITFCPGVKIGEDIGFELKYLLYCRSAYTFDKKLYSYRIHADSAMDYANSSPHLCLDEYVKWLADVKEAYYRANQFYRQRFSIVYYRMMQNHCNGVSKKVLGRHIREMAYKRAFICGVLSLNFHLRTIRKYHNIRGILSFEKKVLISCACACRNDK